MSLLRTLNPFARGRQSELSETSELTPLSDRLALMLVVRLFMGGSVLFSAAVLSQLTLHATARYAALVYIALALFCELAHRFLTRVTSYRWLFFVNGMLLVDGLFVATVLAGSGQSRSAFVFLAYAHIVSVTLLIGFRTGLKMALWHSILLLSVYYLGLAGLVSVLGIAGQSTDKAVSSQLEVAQATALWLVAIVTASFSALNERELRRRKGELSIIADLAVEIEKTRRPSEILAAVNNAAIDKLNAVRAVALVSHGGQIMVVGTEPSDQWSINEPSLIAAGDTVAAAVEGAGPVLVRSFDGEKDALLARALPDAENIAVVPMVAEGETLGVLAVEWGSHSRGRVTRATVNLLQNVTGRVALSLSNTFLLAEVQRLASVDGLTNLANRRTFNISFEREVNRALRSGQPLSLVILDIDHFKAVNDTYGHQTGDTVIAESAAGVAAACRTEDLPARYGGEEIVVIMPNCSAEQAWSAAERIRTSMAAANTTLTHITASAGVATLHVNARDAVGLLAAADEALYFSKENGRNQTTLSTKPADKAASHSSDDAPREPAAQH